MRKRPKTVMEMSEVAQIDDGSKANFCFVIMSFSGNPILESYYEEAIKPTVEAFGLNCVRVDQENFSGEISKRIRMNIERSRLVIVDLTEDRPNCFFEAGYAVAKSKPIIFQRLNAPKYETNFPINVKDYNHILYGTVAHLRRELTGRLRALLSKAPKKSEP